MPCTPELLADVELFEHMDGEDRARLAQFIGGRELPAGTLLFQAGQPGEAMYVVKRGEIELYIKDNAGQKIALATAGVGQVFGEMALLDHGPRTATARALEDSELLELDRDSLLLLFRTTPTAALSLLAAMSHMTRKADELAASRRYARELSVDHPDVIRVADRNGVDISCLRARQVRPADFRRFTHVIALDHDNLANLRKLAPADATAELSLLLDHVEGREGQAVTDPWFGDEAGFEVTWAEVTAAAATLAAGLRRDRG